jgi:hypothetical protein
MSMMMSAVRASSTAIGCGSATIWVFTNHLACRCCVSAPLAWAGAEANCMQ